MASRVPLLVKSKGRKPSRVSIAPRAKPSSAPRTKRAAPHESSKPNSDAVDVEKTPENQKPAEKSPVLAEKVTSSSAEKLAKAAAPAAKIAVAKPATVAKPSVVAKPSLVAKPKPSVVVKPAAIITGAACNATAGVTGASASQPRKTGGISVGGSLSTTSPSALLKSSGTRPVPTVRSPIVLPMQRRPERLAKITSAGPVYRASPVVRPRAGSISSSPAARPRGGSTGSSPAAGPQKAMKQRLLRKLDIKPHQSPRRSAMQQQQQNLRNQDGPASPLMLGGKPAPEISKEVPDVQLDAQQSRRATTTKATRARTAPAKKKRAVPAKRRKTSETTSVKASNTASTPQRRSLRRKTKRSNYRDTDGSGSSGSEPDDDRDEDVDPNDLDLPADERNVYVPARERATMWAKSLLEEGDKADGNKEGEGSQALVVREKKTPVRRKRSNSNASSASSVVTGIGGGIPRSKMEELLKKEPSQMTMGELALTVPKGRRMKRHEREEAASDTPLLTGLSVEGSSNLLNVNALNRVRSLSVSSESAAFAGSLVTPQVQIIDGQMVVMENTIKLGDELQRTADALGEGSVGGESMGLPPRHSGSRYNSSHPNGPGKRWGKEETKQFYYCLSQVGPNFSMMATLFPTRKRKELKSKFKYEEKNHAQLIEIALRASTAPLDSEMVDVISQMVDKEAQRKLEAQKKKRKPRSQLDLLRGRQNDDTASVASSVASSPMSTPLVHTEEFVETLNDEDLFPPSRRGSFDFSG